VAPEQNHLPVLYSYCNSFFIRVVHGNLFGSVNVHLFDIWCAISSRKSGEKSGDFSVWRVVTM